MSSQIKNSWRWQVCKIEFTPLFVAYGRSISEIMKQIYNIMPIIAGSVLAQPEFLYAN